MNKRTHIITSTTIFALSFSGLMTPALAEDPDTSSKNSENTTNTVDKLTQAAALESTDLIQKEFSAMIVLTDSENTQIIDITEENQTISDILKQENIDIENYRSSDNTSINGSQIINNNDNIILFKSEITGTSEIITVPIPEVEEETSELYEGETKVVSEGSEGEALKTVISTTNLSTDKKVNEKTQNSQTSVTTNEKLTVIKAPTAKVTLIGTGKKKAIEEVSPIATSQDELLTNDSDTATTAAQSDSNSTATTNTKATTGSTASETSAPTTTTTASTATTDSTTTEDIHQQAVDIALSRVGKPYVWASTGPDAFDCSGLINWTYKNNLGIDLPRTANSIGNYATPISIDELQPGDILWSPTHITMYIGDGKVVHASGSRQRVVVDPADWFINTGFKAARINA